MEMRKILQMAYVEGITVTEARSRVANLNSAVTKRHTPPNRPDSQSTVEIETLKVQLHAVQQELKLLKDSVIPKINMDIEMLTEDMVMTIEKVDRFDQRFDNVLKRQEDNAESQSARFDKLERMMSTMMATLGTSTKAVVQAHPTNHHLFNQSQMRPDRLHLLRNADVMLSCPSSPSIPSTYCRLTEQEEMDQSASQYH